MKRFEYNRRTHVVQTITSHPVISIRYHRYKLEQSQSSWTVRNAAIAASYCALGSLRISHLHLGMPLQCHIIA